MRRLSILGISALAACDPAWAERGQCGDIEAEDGPASMVTFPSQELRCADGERAPCVLAEPLYDEGARSVPVREALGGVTRTYVLTSVEIPEASSTGEAVGVDLDGFDSGEGSLARDATCEEFNEDFASALEPGLLGVDNALQSLVSAIEYLLPREDCPGMVASGCLDATIRGALRSGATVILLEVSGLDSFVHDPEVVVSLYEGAWGGAAPPPRDVLDRPEPGQLFTTLRALGSSTRGDVFRGRLRADFDHVELPLPAPVPRVLSRVSLRGALCEGHLTHAHLGGVVSRESLEALAAAELLPFDPELVRNVLMNVADIGPSAEDSQVCELVSVGYAIEGVAARREP